MWVALRAASFALSALQLRHGYPPPAAYTCGPDSSQAGMPAADRGRAVAAKLHCGRCECTLLCQPEEGLVRHRNVAYSTTSCVLE